MKNIGVVDAEYIVHHGIPTLGESKNKVSTYFPSDILFFMLWSLWEKKKETKIENKRKNMSLSYCYMVYS